MQRYLSRLILLCVLPLATMGLAMSYLQFQRRLTDEGDSAKSLALLLARDVEQTLQARQLGLQAFATASWSYESSPGPHLHQEARAISKTLGGPVLLIDSQRRIRLQVDATDDDAVPLDAHIEAARMAFETAQPAVSESLVGEVHRDKRVVVAVPMLRQKRVVFVVANVIPREMFESLLDGLPLPRGWSVAVVDSNGHSIARRGDVASAAAVASASALGLRRVLQVVEPAPSLPWQIEVGRPHEGYVQHLLNVAPTILILLGGATLISLLGGSWATHRLVSAVRSLASPTLAPPPPDELEEIRQTRLVLNEALQQRQAATESLRLHEAQWRQIFESASEAIITVDPSQTIVLANAAAARIFGRPIPALVGLPLDELLPVRHREAHRAHVMRFGQSADAARSMSERATVVGLRADGSEFPLEAAISQVRVDGRPLYTVILRDVTQRIEAEAAVAAGKARLEATLESLNDGLAIADIHHDIVDVNPAFMRLYGLSSKTACLQSIEHFATLLEISTLDGQVLPQEQWAMSRALAGERGNGVELQVRHKDNGRRWIASFSYGPIVAADGQITGAVFSVRDVTERKRLADELQSSHRDLERLLAAQSSVQEEERKRIARELHDELQQVLAAIKIDIGLICSEQATDPQRLHALADRMDRLVTAAISSSRRIVTDLRPPLLEEFGLVAALEALATQFMERLPIHVRLDAADIGPEGSEPGHAVALCLYRVAQEALNNVAKHSGAENVTMRLFRTHQGGWRLEIADDGRGFSALDRLKPTSFGLRGMTERVRALGGELRVDGEPGQGVVVVASIGRRPVPDAPA